MNKETTNICNAKAKTQSKEIKVLKKELLRQKKRAEDWRAKAKVLKDILVDKELIIKDLSLKKITNDTGQSPNKIGTHRYSPVMVTLCVHLYKCGLSLRQVSLAIVCIGIFIGRTLQTPSHSIISIWVHKVGLSLLEKGQQRFRESTEQWCLIIDESYSLGKSRLLVVLAVPLSSLQQGRIKTSEVVPIAIKSQEYWKTEDVTACFSEACRRFKGRIAYVTSDSGQNLLCMYKGKGLNHVPDWAHFSANVLENIYEKEKDFKAFNEKMGIFKRKRKQSIYTHYVPPSLSLKVRFMNYIPFLEWATIMLADFKRIPKEIKPELAFLEDLKPFIVEMCALFYTVRDIGLVLKTQGIKPKTYGLATQKLNKLANDYPNSSKVQVLKQAINAYFKQTLAVYHEYIEKQDKNVSFFDGIVATSEIIECLFGKLKHRSDKNPKRGFSGNSLLISLFCNEIVEKDTINALQDINCRALEKWKNKNICNRNYTSFRNIFKKNRGRKNRTV